MFNKKGTKRALLSSVLALLLCCSMLIGTTFAWFTDEVVSANNIITAGNLDVELYHTDSAVTRQEVSSTVKLFDDVTLWEPGAVAYETLEVVNEGDLALKYQLGINISEASVVLDDLGNAHTLAEVLKIAVVDYHELTSRDAAIAAGKTAGFMSLSTFMQNGELKTNGESMTYGVVIYWEPGENDNLFNLNNDRTTQDGKSVMTITLGVTLFATQLMNENDSYGPDYDEKAPIVSPAVPVVADQTTTITTNAVTVEIPANTPAMSGVTEVAVTYSEPEVVNGTLTFDSMELVDQNGNEIDLSSNTTPISVTVPVDTSVLPVGETVDIFHDGVLIATGTVDAEGNVSYTTNHFCEVAIYKVNSVTTADELVAAIANGGYIKLANSIETVSIVTINNNVILNGNGYTLTSTAGRAINVSGVNGVTIMNLTINASGERAINIIQNATNVTINNVTATAANYTVNVASSAPNAIVAVKNSTLNGLCTVNVSAAGAKVTVDNSTVNCNDKNTTAGESYAALSLNKEATGGSIIATNSTINVAEGSDSFKGRNGVHDGIVTINGSDAEVYKTVAVITYPGPYYHGFFTLADAVEFAKAGDVITLIDDVTITETIEINEDLTIVLNGYNLTCNVNKARAFKLTANDVDFVLNANGSNVTFGNGTYGVIEIGTGLEGCTVTVNDGNFEGTTDCGAFVKLRNGANHTVNLNNVTYTEHCAIAGANTNNPYVMGSSGTTIENIVVNVNGGTYNVGCGFGFSTNVAATFTGVTLSARGAAFELANATIENCNITLQPGAYVYSAYGAGVAVANNGTVTIRNTTITSDLYALVVFPTGGVINAENCVINCQKGNYIYELYASAQKGEINVN